MRQNIPVFNNSHLSKTDIIIYGASAWGELAFRALETQGILPSFFCDRAAVGQTRFDTPVIAPEELARHKNAAVLLASADFFNEMRDFMDSIGHTGYYSIKWLLELPIPEEKLSKRALEMLDNSFLYEEASIRVPGELGIVHLGFAVTERCTLRCRDCSFLMTHYTDPHDIDLFKYKPAFDLFLSAIDRVSELRLYGGEPFLNKDWYKMIDWYGDSEKISRITVYTNGTVIPERDAIERMRHTKVKVHISDYVINRPKIEKVKAALQENGVPSFIREYDEWQLGGGLENRDFNEVKKAKVYEKCFMANCYSFIKGRMYGCPRAAHGINMGVIPNFTSDYVDFKKKNYNISSIRSELISLMNAMYLESCGYCDGFNNKIPGVKAGIQIGAD